MTINPLIVLVSVAALVFYFATGAHVARIRSRHGVFAPAMSGHPSVERALRVQGNTLEWLVVFLPALWMFYPFWGAYLAAALGVLWIVGRIVYWIGYMRDVKSRAPGFFIQGLVVLVLLIGSIIGAVRGLSAG